MELTPFKYLKQNIDKVQFVCNPKYVQSYKKSFANVLDRLDKFFVDHGLYDCGDYFAYVQKIVGKEKYLRFNIEKLTKQLGWDGVFWRTVNGGTKIALAPESFGKGLETEGVLCHEFLHYLTIGQKQLTYTKGNKKIEVGFGLSELDCSKKIWDENSRVTTKIADLSVVVLNGGFVCEAMTELTKQRIYSATESHFAYLPQTQMMTFVNKMLGGTMLNTREFLQGSMQKLANAMGNNFYEFYKKSEDFQKKYSKNTNLDFVKDKDYIQLQDIFVNNFFKSLQTNISHYTASDLARIFANLKSAPITKNYDKLVEDTKNLFKQNIDQKNAEKFDKLLENTVQDLHFGFENIVALQSSIPVKFKQTKNGIQICYDALPFVGFENFPKDGKAKILSYRCGNDIVDIISKYTNDCYNLRFRNRTTGKTETINVRIDEKNIFACDDSGKNFEINFENTKKIRLKQTLENINLLDNFEYFDSIQKILNARADIFDIRKITRGKQEYFVASGRDDTLFFAIENKNVQPIAKKINTTFDRKSLGQNLLDQDSVLFELADGTNFVKYYNKNGKLCFGEVQNKQSVVTLQNDTVYCLANDCSKLLFENKKSIEEKNIEL